MLKTKNEIIGEYIKLLAEDEKPLGLTEEQYRALQRGEFATSGTGSEWEPDLSPEKKEMEDYRYSPEEKVYRGPRRDDDPLKGRYSKKPSVPETEVSGGESEWSGSKEQMEKIIDQDPIYATVELKIHRDPSSDFDTVYYLANSLHSWLKGAGIDPEPGTILYDEIEHMLNILNEKMKEKEKSIKQ